MKYRSSLFSKQLYNRRPASVFFFVYQLCPESRLTLHPDLCPESRLTFKGRARCCRRACPSGVSAAWGHTVRQKVSHCHFGWCLQKRCRVPRPPSNSLQRGCEHTSLGLLLLGGRLGEPSNNAADLVQPRSSLSDFPAQVFRADRLFLVAAAVPLAILHSTPGSPGHTSSMLNYMTLSTRVYPSLTSFQAALVGQLDNGLGVTRIPGQPGGRPRATRTHTNV